MNIILDIKFVLKNFKDQKYLSKFYRVLEFFIIIINKIGPFVKFSRGLGNIRSVCLIGMD